MTMPFGETRATYLVELVEQNCELFLDEEERPFAAINPRPGVFHVPVPSPGPPDAAYLAGSKAFHQMLVQLFYANERKVVANSSVKSAVWVLEGLARKNSKHRKVWTLLSATRKAEPTYRSTRTAACHRLPLLQQSARAIDAPRRGRRWNAIVADMHRLQRAPGRAARPSRSPFDDSISGVL